MKKIYSIRRAGRLLLLVLCLFCLGVAAAGEAQIRSVNGSSSSSYTTTGTSGRVSYQPSSSPATSIGRSTNSGSSSSQSFVSSPPSSGSSGGASSVSGGSSYGAGAAGDANFFVLDSACQGWSDGLLILRLAAGYLPYDHPCVRKLYWIHGLPRTALYQYGPFWNWGHIARTFKVSPGKNYDLWFESHPRWFSPGGPRIEPVCAHVTGIEVADGKHTWVPAPQVPPMVGPFSQGDNTYYPSKLTYTLVTPNPADPTELLGTEERTATVSWTAPGCI